MKHGRSVASASGLYLEIPSGKNTVQHIIRSELNQTVLTNLIDNPRYPKREIENFASNPR